jgi:hypothetical protein
VAQVAAGVTAVTEAQGPGCRGVQVRTGARPAVMELGWAYRASSAAGRLSARHMNWKCPSGSSSSSPSARTLLRPSEWYSSNLSATPAESACSWSSFQQW